MTLNVSGNQTEVFNSVNKYLLQLQLPIVSKDENRPWGGFFVIDEDKAFEFAKIFFPEIEQEKINLTGKLSPKILIVAPGKRLSWQYHHRRAELWKLIAGEAGIIKSSNDQQGEEHTLQQNDIVKLNQGERHRLIGLDTYGIVAEIWQHTDPANPSDENDIVRLQDDFGR